MWCNGIVPANVPDTYVYECFPCGGNKAVWSTSTFIALDESGWKPRGKAWKAVQTHRLCPIVDGLPEGGCPGDADLERGPGCGSSGFTGLCW